MKYKVVTSDDIFGFEESVNDLLAKGWLLFGGVAVSNWCWRGKDGDMKVDTEYCQAMTLEGEEKTA
jgi:hypothetical protein